MNQPTRLFFLAVVLAIGAGFLDGPASAQDARAVAAKQKDEVQANLKKAGVNASVVETDNFFVAGTLPEEKLKALGAVLEKVVPVARKGLQYDAKDEAWKGKLSVYYLPESRDFKSFLRSVLMSRPESVYYDVRSETPLVVDPVDVSGKASEADLFSNTAGNVAAAYLKAKGSTANLPEWLRIGFGKATALRAEGLNSMRYLAYKKAVKSVAAGGKGNPPAAIADLWSEGKPANYEVLAASLVEYMAYGPGAENFIKLVYGFRPDENGNSPSVAQAFEAAGWKETAMLEKAWQKWVATGK